MDGETACSSQQYELSGEGKVLETRMAVVIDELLRNVMVNHAKHSKSKQSAKTYCHH